MKNLMKISLIVLSLGCSTGMTSLEENKEAVRYFIEEMLAKGNLDEYKERRAVNFICHAPDGDFNLDQDYQNALEVQQVMHGFDISILELVAEKDLVMVFWQAESDVEIGTGMILFRVEDGKLTEEWPSMPFFKKK